MGKRQRIRDDYIFGTKLVKNKQWWAKHENIYLYQGRVNYQQQVFEFTRSIGEEDGVYVKWCKHNSFLSKSYSTTKVKAWIQKALITSIIP